MLNPTGDRIAILRDIVEEKIGSLFIPETSQPKPERGVVVAVGPGPRNIDGEYIPMNIENGDQVAFKRNAGVEIDVDGQKILILSESDVLAIL